MTVSVGALSWQEQSDAAQPLANYTVNFGADPAWQFNLTGMYHFQGIYPKGVTIDNSAGNGTITVVCAAFTVNVLPFTQQPIDLSNVSQQITIRGTGLVYSVPIVFWLKLPAGQVQNQFAIQQAVDNLTPGFMIFFAGPIIPAGWLACNGQAVSRTGATANLFGTIGTTYGAGDGLTTFNLPDLRGMVPGGMDVMDASPSANRLSTVIPASNTLGANGGTQQITLNATQIPAHNHPFNDPGHAHSFASVQNTGAGADLGGPGVNNYAATNTNNAVTNASVGNSIGGGLPHNNVQPTTLFNILIKM